MSTTATIGLEVPDLAGLDRASDLEIDRVDAAVGRGATARRCRAVAAGRRGQGALVARARASTGSRSVRALAPPTPSCLEVTGTSGPEARTLVAVGEMMDAPSPWLAEVADGVGAGDVSVAAAAAIQQGLGLPTADVAADDLADAAHTLVVEAAILPPEKVARRARELRDQLDADGVADREALLREKRFLRLTPLPDGMTRHRRAPRPRVGGDRHRRDRPGDRPATRRTPLRRPDPEGARRGDRRRPPHHRTADPGCAGRDGAHRRRRRRGPVFGTRKPGVRVHVTVADLDRRAGAGHIEGQTASISHRDRRAASLRRRLPPDPVRRLRPGTRPGTHAAPVLREAAHRARRDLGRMRDPRLRPTTLLDRSPPRRRMGPPQRPDRRQQRCPALPPPPHVGARHAADESDAEAPNSGSNHHPATR